MSRIPLENIHQNLGARMVDYAGFSMPLQYEGVSAEHIHVRKKVGIFDVSHMGEFRVTGEAAESFIQKMTSNDVTKLVDGKIQYSCLMNSDGGIVDDLLVYRFNDKEYLLVVNASNITKDLNWLESNNDGGAVITDESEDTALFAVQGPDANQVLQKLTEVQLDEMKYYTFTTGTFAGVDNVIISATGYTGSGGFEIYVPAKEAEKVWRGIMEAGEEYDIKPVGLGARDTLRIEAGFCLYGNDINDSTSPLEANLGWITKPDSGFISSDKIKQQKENGTERKLIGFVMKDRGIPREGYLIKSAEGQVIGKVTSGTQSPLTKDAIGLGYVQKEYAKTGEVLKIEIRNKVLDAEVKKPPFFEK